MKHSEITPFYFMTSLDVKEFYGCHIQTARRILREIRDARGRQLSKRVSLEEFSAHQGISMNLLREFKLEKRKKKGV